MLIRIMGDFWILLRDLGAKIGECSECKKVNCRVSAIPMRYTQTTLKKLEGLFDELDYTIRYEKGNFQSGYCIVENRRIAVVNKFFDTEARINCLLEILSGFEFDAGNLSDASRELIEKWKKETE